LPEKNKTKQTHIHAQPTLNFKKDTNRVNVQWTKTHEANSGQNKAEMTISIFNKIDFITENITRDGNKGVNSLKS
jgi:hypothetical protein